VFSASLTATIALYFVDDATGLCSVEQLAFISINYIFYTYVLMLVFVSLAYLELCLITSCSKSCDWIMKLN